MTQIRISHRTVYHYRSAVSLSPHRLMLRPRESRELQLMSHTLTVSPDATIAWAHDVSGNAVATASFIGKTDVLRIESNLELDLTGRTADEWTASASRERGPARNVPASPGAGDRLRLDEPPVIFALTRIPAVKQLLQTNDVCTLLRGCGD